MGALDWTVVDRDRWRRRAGRLLPAGESRGNQECGVQQASGSRLSITERGEVYNPIFRALSRFVFGYTGTIESCLEAAKKKLN